MLSVHTSPLAALGGKKTGGMNVYVRDLTKELGRRGHVVDVFTRSQDTSLPYVNELSPNCAVIRIPAGPEIPLDNDAIFAHTSEFVAGVLRYAREHGRTYDIIHSHYWLSGLAAVQLRDAWGAPIVQMFHTLGLMKNEVSEFTGETASERRIAAETEVMAAAERLIAASPLEKSQMVWRYGAEPARVAVVPLAVNRERFRPIDQGEAKRYLGIDADKRIVLFVGRIEPLKGLDTLLRAMKRVFAQWPGCRRQLCLVVIGGDASAPRSQMSEEMRRLQDVSREQGLDDLVMFLGRRNQEILPYYYSASAVVVMPSYYESFGLVALEAMSCGAPVIASRVGGLSFTVVEGVTGFQTPAGDDEHMAERILQVLRDDDLRARLGDQAAQLAACYSWSDVASQLEKSYAEALSLQPVRDEEPG